VSDLKKSEISQILKQKKQDYGQMGQKKFVHHHPYKKLQTTTTKC